MKDATPSATALVVSLIRSLHTRTAPEPLIDDPWGEKLIPYSLIASMQQAITTDPPGDSEPVDEAATQAGIEAQLRANSAYANVILRSRYTEDALHDAVERGVTQYVLIGAGFDSYSLRVPAAARHLRIFEVDHPATQEMKTRRLAECGVTPGESVQYLPADLSQESLGSALSKSTFDSSKPTFFSLLGVTMYLSLDDNRAAMREIARCSAAGSELVFTYIDQVAFASGSESAPEEFKKVQASVAAVGEPFKSGFDPSSLGQNLHSAGLRLDEDLHDIELIERYDSQGANGLESSVLSRIARASVV